MDRQGNWIHQWLDFAKKPVPSNTTSFTKKKSDHFLVATGGVTPIYGEGSKVRSLRQDAFRALGSGRSERLGCLELRKLAKFTGPVPSSCRWYLEPQFASKFPIVVKICGTAFSVICCKPGFCEALMVAMKTGICRSLGICWICIDFQWQLWQIILSLSISALCSWQRGFLFLPSSTDCCVTLHIQLSTNRYPITSTSDNKSLLLRCW